MISVNNGIQMSESLQASSAGETKGWKVFHVIPGTDAMLETICPILVPAVISDSIPV